MVTPLHTDRTFERSNMASNSTEDIVRRYLTYLRAPQTFMDEAQLRRLHAELDQAEDIIEQLHLLSSIELAETVDPAVLRTEFVKVVSGYAEEHGLTPGAFSKLGVADDVLREAGLAASKGMVIDMAARRQAEEALEDDSEADDFEDVDEDFEDVIESDTDTDDDADDSTEVIDLTEEPAPAKVTRRGRNNVTVTTGSAPSKRGRVTQADIVAMLPSQPFTVKQIVDLSGASQLTVRRTIDSLIDDGVLRGCGTDPSYQGVGRSPMRYQLANQRVASA